MSDPESADGLKYRMPVSGLPTKLPLLKITHGCCEPLTKRFQNTWYTAGTGYFRTSSNLPTTRQ